MSVDTSAVIELRQYTLHPGKRDVLIDLFDREFVETQEAAGMRILGQFRDLYDSDRFVWLRGFRDMPSRAVALRAFYGGPVWKAHRATANATMIDSENVLLLQPVDSGSGFSLPLGRPPTSTPSHNTSLVGATIYFLEAAIDDEFIRFFEGRVTPLMIGAGAQPIARFRTVYAENTFPALPVRTGENVLVWFSSFAGTDDYNDHLARLARSEEWNQEIQGDLFSRFKSPPQQLLLEPTSRSLLGHIPTTST